MQVFSKLELDQPAVKPSIDKAFIVFAPERRCALGHTRQTKFNFTEPGAKLERWVSASEEIDRPLWVDLGRWPEKTQRQLPVWSVHSGGKLQKPAPASLQDCKLSLRHFGRATQVDLLQPSTIEKSGRSVSGA